MLVSISKKAPRKPHEEQVQEHLCGCFSWVREQGEEGKDTEPGEPQKESSLGRPVRRDEPQRQNCYQNSLFVRVPAEKES